MIECKLRKRKYSFSFFVPCQESKPKYDCFFLSFPFFLKNTVFYFLELLSSRYWFYLQLINSDLSPEESWTLKTKRTCDNLHESRMLLFNELPCWAFELGHVDFYCKRQIRKGCNGLLDYWIELHCLWSENSAVFQGSSYHGSALFLPLIYFFFNLRTGVP